MELSKLLTTSYEKVSEYSELLYQKSEALGDVAYDFGTQLFPSTLWSIMVATVPPRGSIFGTHCVTYGDLLTVVAANTTRFALFSICQYAQIKADPTITNIVGQLADKIITYRNGPLSENATVSEQTEREDIINDLTIITRLGLLTLNYCATAATSAMLFANNRMTQDSLTTILLAGPLIANILPKPKFGMDPKSSEGIIDLTAANFEQEVIQSHIPVVVDAYATWCGPCKMMEPVINTLSEELKGKVKFAKMNVDQEDKLALQLNVTAMPTLFFYKDGKLLESQIGALNKDDLEAKLQKHFFGLNPA